MKLPCAGRWFKSIFGDENSEYERWVRSLYDLGLIPRIPPKTRIFREKSLRVSRPSLQSIPYEFVATILVAGSSAIILKAKCAPPRGCSRSGRPFAINSSGRCSSRPRLSGRTQFISLFRGDEGTHHGAVIDALCTQISAAHHRLTPAEQLGIFGLQRSEG